jgi:hypothetical protein
MEDQNMPGLAEAHLADFSRADVEEGFKRETETKDNPHARFILEEHHESGGFLTRPGGWER